MEAEAVVRVVAAQMHSSGDFSASIFHEWPSHSIEKIELVVACWRNEYFFYKIFIKKTELNIVTYLGADC